MYILYIILAVYLTCIASWYWQILMPQTSSLGNSGAVLDALIKKHWMLLDYSMCTF